MLYRLLYLDIAGPE